MKMITLFLAIFLSSPAAIFAQEKLDKSKLMPKDLETLAIVTDQVKLCNSKGLILEQVVAGDKIIAKCVPEK